MSQFNCCDFGQQTSEARKELRHLHLRPSPGPASLDVGLGPEKAQIRSLVGKIRSGSRNTPGASLETALARFKGGGVARVWADSSRRIKNQAKDSTHWCPPTEPSDPFQGIKNRQGENPYVARPSLPLSVYSMFSPWQLRRTEGSDGPSHSSTPMLSASPIARQNQLAWLKATCAAAVQVAWAATETLEPTPQVSGLRT